MTDCVFCKIAAGEIPASVVYEDDKVIAFDDLEPQMPVHTLIIPKQHFANIGDGLPDPNLWAILFAIPFEKRSQGIKGHQ